MLRTRWPVALFVPWTLFVWANRIVNALGDDTANVPLTVALALTVVAPTVAAGLVLVRAWSRRLTEVEARLWLATAGWTAIVWLVRGTEIALSDHGVAFKVVHVLIGGVSIALAVGVARAARSEQAAQADGDPTGPRVSPPIGADR
jgi:hypothetical protein